MLNETSLLAPILPTHRRASSDTFNPYRIVQDVANLGGTDNTCPATAFSGHGAWL